MKNKKRKRDKILKERKRCRDNYFRTKCNIERKMPEYVSLGDSSVQDNTNKSSREGSTLARFTFESIKKIGLTLRMILKPKSLQEITFLDVGCGQCYLLWVLRAIFKLYCVGIEINQEHLTSGVAYLFTVIKEQKTIIPFLPIKGDGLSLKSFGGSKVVYAWIEGAPQNLHKHLFDTFQADKDAHVFISDHRDKVVKPHTKLTCTMSHNGGSRNLYFYVKDGSMEKKRDRMVIKDEMSLDNKVRIAFRKFKRFKQISRKTTEKVIEYIHPIENELKPSQKKRNLKRILYKQFF